MGGIVRASLPVFPLTRGLFTVRLGVMPYGLSGQPHGGLAVFHRGKRATVRAGTQDSHLQSQPVAFFGRRPVSLSPKSPRRKPRAVGRYVRAS